MKWLLECKYFHRPQRGRKMKVVSYFWDDEEERMVFFEEAERTVYPHLYTQGDIDDVNDLLGQDIVKLAEARPPEYEVLYNSMKGKKELFLKVSTNSPGEIGGKQGIRDFFRPNSWQDNVKYYQVYATVKELNFGMPYEWNEEDKAAFPEMVTPEIDLDELIRRSPLLKDVLEKYPRDVVDFYFQFFFSSIPDIPSAGMDIEVETVRDFMPDPYKAEFPVTTVSFNWSNGKKVVFTLKRKKMGEEWHDPEEKIFIKYFESERELLESTYQMLLGLPPIVLTYNGDNFDFSYLHYRGSRYFGLKTPFNLKRKMNWQRGGKVAFEKVELRAHLHFDLYRWFKKGSLKNYVYKGSYENDKLDTVSRALLKEGKLFQFAGLAVGTNYKDEITYCLQDSLLCVKLWELTKGIVFMLMRLTHTTFEETCRREMTGWHANLLRRELHRRGWVFPNRDELRRAAGITTAAATEGSQYEGALVKAEPGIYVMGTVVDFSGLYPGIIETLNLSFETMDCECCDPIENRIPETGHWVCQRRKGIVPELIGFFRAIRVAYFKPLKIKDVEQGLKVLVNGWYGAFAHDMFAFNCPSLSESTTAGGRVRISEVQQKAEDLSITTFFGHTDSAGLLTQDDVLLNEIIQWAYEKFNIELEVDYKFKVMFLHLKGNYVVIFMDGTHKIVGMTGKKKDSPQLFKDCFKETIEALKGIEVI